MKTTSRFSRELIEVMPAGIELDALIAECIFGYRWVFTNDDVPWMQKGVAELKPANWVKNAGSLESWRTAEGVLIEHGKGNSQDWRPGFPAYSANIAAAWQIIERQHNIYPTVRVFPRPFVRPTVWHCQLDETIADADSAPLAICRAALIAAMPA